jgi:hypothetical protein
LSFLTSLVWKLLCISIVTPDFFFKGGICLVNLFPLFHPKSMFVSVFEMGSL